ncbi:MAG TPA: hypothetical protein P5533_02800, partial [Candidatus Cloacimonadota bacterium]|nr:hypothetical protein [Candidatus Cloacimonadota bacterium]
FLVILSDPGSAAPLSPAPLSISLQSGNRHLSWPAVTLDTEGQDVTGVSYKIYRATRPDFSDEILLSETAALTYLDTAPAANRYFYRVTANM